MTTHTFKLTMVGDGGVGKTTFLKRMLTGDFVKKYIPTMGAEVHPLTYYTNRGEVTFNVWDTAGQEKFAGLAEEYWLGSDAFFVMFDITSKISARNSTQWIERIRKNYPETPIVLVVTKVDLVNHGVISKHDAGYAGYMFISAKSCYNFEKPWLHLMQTLLKDETVKIVEAPEIVE